MEVNEIRYLDAPPGYPWIRASGFSWRAASEADFSSGARLMGSFLARDPWEPSGTDRIRI